MKLSFSTFGWDGFTWDKLCSTARECGFTGIEIHNIHEPVFSGYQNLFDPALTSVTVLPYLPSRRVATPCIFLLKVVLMATEPVQGEKSPAAQKELYPTQLQ